MKKITAFYNPMKLMVAISLFSVGIVTASCEANNSLITELKNEIIEILKRSQSYDAYGTTYRFTESTLIIDRSKARGSDCPQTPGYVNKDHYDVSMLIASVSRPDTGLRLKCDSNSNCRMLQITGHFKCNINPVASVYDNAGWIEVDSVPEARRLEELLYKLRSALNNN